MPRCRPGDLAVVINAHHRSNIGRIVKVIGLHDGQGDLGMRLRTDAVWNIEATAGRLTWLNSQGRRCRRKRGPAPDVQLQPIRGDGPQVQADEPLSLKADLAEDAAPASPGPGLNWTAKACTGTITRRPATTIVAVRAQRRPLVALRRHAQGIKGDRPAVC